MKRSEQATLSEVITVVGAGLAGCEAAYKLANAGLSVRLCEMKPQKYTPAHHYPGFAELVCSNSLKAARIETAAGLLKEEMRQLRSLIMQAADRCAVSAGGALAVDREKFSDYITEKIRSHPGIILCPGEVTAIPEGRVVIASGPLTSEPLAAAIQALCHSRALSFYDAAAPIVAADSIDPARTFLAARYDRGEPDYINCPFTREEYEAFYEALLSAETVQLHAYEKEYFRVYEGCMPVEVMARRGPDTLRFGPLKPVGLRDPRTGRRPWAVVQLRRENAEGSMYNLVGFQTNLRFPEQRRVFGMIPGLAQAEFLRYGVMHRNTFLDSPRLLSERFCLRAEPRVWFAGQMTGVEGYIESAASGILAAEHLARELLGLPPLRLPRESMTGALSAYIADQSVVDFQPMGCNMGLLPPLPERVRGKQARYAALAERGIEALRTALAQAGPLPVLAAE